MFDPYRVLTYEEVKEKDMCEEYSYLVGPDGFDCVLSEPEDCTWNRDGYGVVAELNRMYNKVIELYGCIAELKKIDKLRMVGCRCPAPLIGEKWGEPRCRLCNVAFLFAPPEGWVHNESTKLDTRDDRSKSSV